MTDAALLRIKSDLHYAIQRVDSSICYLSSVIENYDALPENIRISLDDAFISLDETKDEMECILEDIEIRPNDAFMAQDIEEEESE